MVPPYTSFPPVSSEKVSLASPFFAIQQAARGRGKIDRHTSTRQEEADEVDRKEVAAIFTSDERSAPDTIA